MSDFLELLSGLDLGLLKLINISCSNAFFDLLFPSITDLHKTFFFKFVFVPFIAIFLSYKYRYRGFSIFVFFVAAIGISDFIGGQVKHLFMRPRPFTTYAEIIQRSPAGGFSFPSNHASNMICTAIFLGMFFPKYRRIFFGIAFLVLLSRLYNGVHYPSDALGGAIIGGTFGYLISKLCQRWNIWWDQKINMEKMKE